MGPLVAILAFLQPLTGPHLKGHQNTCAVETMVVEIPLNKGLNHPTLFRTRNKGELGHQESANLGHPGQAPSFLWRTYLLRAGLLPGCSNLVAGRGSGWANQFCPTPKKQTSEAYQPERAVGMVATPNLRAGRKARPCVCLMLHVTSKSGESQFWTSFS